MTIITNLNDILDAKIEIKPKNELFIQARNEVYNYIRNNVPNFDTYVVNKTCYGTYIIPKNVTLPTYISFNNEWFTKISIKLKLPPVYISENEYNSLCKSVWYEKEYHESLVIWAEW